MGSLRRIISNTIISLAGQAVTWTSTLLLTIACGRYLSDVKFGELYFALTFALLIGTPLEYSFNSQITRDVAQEPGKALSYFSNVVIMKSALWLLLYGGALLVCRQLGYNGEEQALVAICGLNLLSDALGTTARSLHYAFERVYVPVVGTILEKVLCAVCGILLLKAGAGVEIIALVLLGSACMNTIWQVVSFFHVVGLRFVIDLKLMRILLRTSIPFFIYGVLGVVYARIDVFLLSLMTNAAVVGWYGAGYRLFDTLSFLPALIITPIMYPLYSKLAIRSEQSLKLAIEKSTNFILFFGTPIATGLIVAAPGVVSFLYQNPQFSHTIPVLQLLAPGILFLYINTVLNNTLVSTKREHNILLIAALCLIFNLGLNLLFIPVYQHIAAAIITSLTELLILCLSLLFLPKRLIPFASLRTGIKSIIASFVMALAIWPLHTLGIFAILPVAMFVYFGSATLLGAIPRADLRALYHAIRYKGHSTGNWEELPETPASSYPFHDLPTTPLPSFYTQVNPLASIELATTLKLPAIPLQRKRPGSLKAVRLQPVRHAGSPHPEQIKLLRKD